ncbi:uncharacterized protein MKK02DRAFT_30088 [Dioszegia hungarica]|uniref:Uncharacterized protein n=1 Tax=Dioszegia hungarica TaxID=4972 RepID=A0AA38LQP7_9TREE|nr:uncharacterized protein MKK02DRAFT_30088 [Dioszegia hungarica]KAI9632220.1 hypothetical protein MKK02DRAFT_30088 [Dioszegia hungarica]
MSAPALNATTSASATLSSRSPITNNNTTNNETGDDSNGTEVFRFSMSGTAPIGTMGIVGTWAMKRKEGETLWNGECCPPRADGRICPPQRLINDIAAKFPGITDLNDQENATKAFISYAGHNMRNWKRGRFHLSYDSTKETTNQEHKADLTTHPCRVKMSGPMAKRRKMMLEPASGARQIPTAEQESCRDNPRTEGASRARGARGVEHPSETVATAIDAASELWPVGWRNPGIMPSDTLLFVSVIDHLPVERYPICSRG